MIVTVTQLHRRNENINRTFYLWKTLEIIERIERNVLRSNKQLKHAIKEAGTRLAEENEISE